MSPSVRAADRPLALRVRLIVGAWSLSSFGRRTSDRADACSRRRDRLAAGARVGTFAAAERPDRCREDRSTVAAGASLRWFMAVEPERVRARPVVRTLKVWSRAERSSTTMRAHGWSLIGRWREPSDRSNTAMRPCVRTGTTHVRWFARAMGHVGEFVLRVIVGPPECPAVHLAAGHDR